MFTRVLFVIFCAAWVIYGTYTVMAAVFAPVPQLPEAPRAMLLAVLVVGVVVAVLGLLLQRLGGRLVGEVRRAVAEARPSAIPPAGELRGIDPDVFEAGLRLKRRLEGQ